MRPLAWLWHRLLCAGLGTLLIACILLAFIIPARLGNWIDAERWRHDEMAWQAWGPMPDEKQWGGGDWLGCVVCLLGGLAVLAALVIGLLRFGGARWF